ncbi:MAG: tRNA-dihydrouridine synthase, partial [Phycisphaeraceae bacterium]
RSQDPGPRTQNPGPRTQDFLLGGSGDIWTAHDIFRMIEETGVAFVSVARGCIGNPWIFHQARALMRGDLDGATRPPSIGQQRQVLLEHFQLSVDQHGENRTGIMMRKFGIKFSRHHPQGPEVAKAFVAVKSLDDWQRVLETFYGDEAMAGIVADMSAQPLRPGGGGEPEDSCEQPSACGTL